MARTDRFLLTKEARNGVAYTRAPKQELLVANRLGGVKTPASGSQDMKGDVRVPKVIRIECKNTQAKSFTVSLDMIRKMHKSTVGYGETFAVEIDFIDSKGKVLESVAVVPTHLLDEIAHVRKQMI